MTSQATFMNGGRTRSDEPYSVSASSFVPPSHAMSATAAASTGTSSMPASTAAAAAAAAAAPNHETLYETLLRYHAEDDDTSEGWNELNSGFKRKEEQGGASRRGFAGTGTANSFPPIIDGNHGMQEEDRKRPAMPASQLTNGEGRPNEEHRSTVLTPTKPAAADAVNGTNDLNPTSPFQSPGRSVSDSPSSFYKAALEEAARAEAGSLPKPKSPLVPAKPGAVMVHEPAIRPDSVMYRAAYGLDNNELRSSRSGSPTEDQAASASGMFQHNQQPQAVVMVTAHLANPRSQPPIRQRSQGSAGSSSSYSGLHQPVLSHPHRHSPTASPYRQHPQLQPQQQEQQSPIYIPPPMGPEEVRRSLAALRQSKADRHSDPPNVIPPLSASSSREEDTSSINQGRRSPTFQGTEKRFSYGGSGTSIAPTTLRTAQSAGYDSPNNPHPSQKHGMANIHPLRRNSPVRHVSPMHSSTSTASNKPTPNRSASPVTSGGSPNVNNTMIHPGELMDFGSDEHIRATQQRQLRQRTNSSSRPSSRGSSPAPSVASARAPSSRGSSPSRWNSAHSVGPLPTSMSGSQSSPNLRQRQLTSSSHSVGPMPSQGASHPSHHQHISSSHSVASTSSHQWAPYPGQQPRTLQASPRGQSPSPGMPQDQYSQSTPVNSSNGHQYQFQQPTSPPVRNLGGQPSWSTTRAAANGPALSSVQSPRLERGHSSNPSFHSSTSYSFADCTHSYHETASLSGQSHDERQYRDTSNLSQRRELARPSGKHSRNVSAPSVASTVAMMRREYARSRSSESLMFSVYSGSSRSNMSVSAGGEHNNYYNANNNLNDNQDNDSDDSSLDEDFKLALELSLREASNGPPPTGDDLLRGENISRGPHHYPHGEVAASHNMNPSFSTSRQPPRDSHPFPPSSRLNPGTSHPQQRSTDSVWGAGNARDLVAASQFGQEDYRREPEQDESLGMDDFMLALRLSAAEGRPSDPIDTRPRTSSETPSTFQPVLTSDRISSSTNPIVANTNAEADEQYRILQQIREEKELKELELALKASEEESSSAGRIPGVSASTSIAKNLATNFEVSSAAAAAVAATLDCPSSFAAPTNDDLVGGESQGSARDFLISQQLAMEEYERKRSVHTTNSSKSGDSITSSASRSATAEASSARRQHLLERGTKETQEAISSGQARIVRCIGCDGRLQAPMSYSLVFCPKCQTISPA